MDLTLYQCYTKSILKEKSLQELLSQIPKSLHPKALRYKSEISAYNYAIGRILLKEGLKSIGREQELEKIIFLENGKPTLPGVKFNISHSDHQVICSFSKEIEHGVDIEKISPVDFADFKSMFSVKEWNNINNSTDPLRSFYWFWTRKESIIKALGLTLSHLHKIELDVSLQHFVIDDKKWFLTDMDITEGYLTSVCSAQEISNIDVKQLTL